MVGGNITATLQTRKKTKNDLGETAITYQTGKRIKGWLDYSSGQTKYETYQTPAEETTHVFVCNYQAIKADRLLIKGKAYDVLYIDNPMELNEHVEIFLKYVG